MGQDRWFAKTQLKGNENMKEANSVNIFFYIDKHKVRFHFLSVRMSLDYIELSIKLTDSTPWKTAVLLMEKTTQVT